MSSAGWIVMLLSVGAVTLVMLGCVYKVLTTPGETERLHGLDPETPELPRKRRYKHRRRGPKQEPSA